MKFPSISSILAAALVLAISCGDKGGYAEPLLSAEQAVKTDPYDAVVLLEGRKDSLCLSEADSSLYELVYAEALRGLGLRMDAAEHMRRSADFFRQKGDDDRTARALLQTALCLFDGGKYVDAAIKMKEAEAVAATLDSQDLHNRLFLSLAQLNNLIRNDSLSRLYYTRALTAARRRNNPDCTAMTLNAMAAHYLQRGETDRFKWCMSLCEPLLDSIADLNRAAIEANIGCYHIAKGDTAAAKRIFLRSRLICPDRKSSLYLGDIYAKEGDKKKAAAQWYDAANSSDTHIRKTALSRLTAWANARGNTEEALYLSNLLNNTYENDISTATATAIANAQTDFDRQRTQRHNKTVMLLCVVIGTLAVAGTIVFIILTRRRDRRKEARMSRWNIENKLLQADCVRRLHRLAATGKTAPKDEWDALRELVSRYDKPLVLLLERNKSLSAAEEEIVMLTRLRFQPSEMVTLTDTSPQTVTNMRTRLLRKVFGKEGGAKDFDSAIRNT